MAEHTLTEAEQERLLIASHTVEPVQDTGRALFAAVKAILAARLVRVEALHQGIHTCAGGTWGNITEAPCPTMQALAAPTARSWNPCPVHASQNLTDGPCRECSLAPVEPATEEADRG